MASINYLDYYQCRVCYDCKSNLKLLTNVVESSFAQDTEKTYIDLLLDICKINVLEDKPLGMWPQFICFNCSHQLELAHEFIQNSHKINKILQSIAGTLEATNDVGVIDKPELDSSSEIKIEKIELVDMLPNEREFLYSPIESEVLRAEATLPSFHKIENIASMNDHKNVKVLKDENEDSNEVLIVSPVEFIYNGIIIDDDSDNCNTENNIILTNSESNTVSACSECNKLSRSRRCANISEKNKFSCHKCVLKLSRSDVLKKRQRSVHKSNSKEIKRKSEAIKAVANLNCAKKPTAETDISYLTCNVCNKIFNTRRKLSRHKRFVHTPEDKKIPCRICGNKFGRKDHFKRHMKCVHEKEVISPTKKLVKVKQIRFYCDKCDCSYTRRYRLYKHYMTVHGQ